MEIQDLINVHGKLKSYQATFLVITVEQNNYRYDIVNKKEFRLKVGDEGAINYLQHHPLLLNYNEPWASTYINSKPKVVEDFIEDIRLAIDKVTRGWRHWTDFVTNPTVNFTFESFVRNVQEGNGILLNAPLTITSAVINVCNQHETLTKTFEIQIAPKPNKLLMIGSSFVIADGFKKHIPH